MLSATEQDREGAVGGSIAPRMKRVLLAEDDDDVRDALARLLRLAGYEVRCVSSGMQMIEICGAWTLDEEEPPCDFIVTDVRMPGFNGLEVVEGLRKSGWRQPVVVISAFGDAEMQRRVRRLEPAQLFAKPFDPDALERALASFAAP